MEPRNRAVVVGALGVIGRYIVERLQQDETWSTVGLSRRGAAGGPRYRHVAVDLLDLQDVEAKLAGLTDVTHIFYAAFQAAPGAAAGYASNIAPNRDYFRWKNLWPRIAEVFDMPVAEPQTISLTQHMADKGALWQAMTKKYGLQPFAWEQLVGWPFADYVFGSDWDVMTSTTKARQFGFHDVVDTEDMFCRLLSRFRDQRVVP